MNELGLPGHGAEPSFGADEGAYGAVVRAAVRRRRTRALTGTSATAALALAFVAISAGPGGTSSLAPTDTPPARTATASPAPAPSGTNNVPAGKLPPSLPSLPPLPSDTPPPGAAPSAEPSAAPSPGDKPKPKPSHSEPGSAMVWRETFAFVDDRPAESCVERDAVEGWCFRYLGPLSIASGEAVTFTTEMCRLATAQTAGRVDLDYERDMWISLGSPPETPDEDKQYALSMWGIREKPHARYVAPGTCLRWSSLWNGLDFDGEPLRPGTYQLIAFLQGTTPNEGPGQTGEDMWAYGSQAFTVT